jgi:hypothetical protein
MTERIRPGKGEGSEGNNKREATEELDRLQTPNYSFLVDDVRWRLGGPNKERKT